jgi:hypothetical protein
VICFSLPLRLVSEANQASSQHWRVRWKRAKEQKAAAFWGGLRSGCRPASFPARVTITRVAPGTLDSDNLVGSAKHVRDGLAEAMGINDNDPDVEWCVEQRKGKRGEYRVEIRIEHKEGG